MIDLENELLKNHSDDASAKYKKYFSVFFLISSLEATICLFFILAVPSDANNQKLLAYSLPRLLMAAFLIIALLVTAVLAYFSRNNKFPIHISHILNLDSEFKSILLITSGVLSLTFLCLSLLNPEIWVEIRYYIIRLRPIMIWISLFSLQCFLLLNLLPDEKYRQNKNTNILHSIKGFFTTKFHAIRVSEISWWLFLLALLLGLCARLCLAYFYEGNFDQFSYEIVTSFIKDRQNIYFTERYNYTPLWSVILIQLSGIADSTGLPFHFIVRGFLSFIDVFNALLVGFIANQRIKKGFLPAFISYMLNPAAILIVGYHGQFENLSILPLLCAIYFFNRKKQNPPIITLWILATTSLICKHITLFLVWMLLFHTIKKPRRSILLLINSGILFLLSFMPYLPEGRDYIFHNVFLYQGFQSHYGLGSYLPIDFHKLLFYIVMITLPFLTRYILKFPIEKALLFCSIGFLTFTYGLGEQYFILAVIFGSIYSKDLLYWVMSICVTLFLLNSPNNINLWNNTLTFDQRWLYPTWLAFVVWFISFLLPFNRRSGFSPSLPRTEINTHFHKKNKNKND